MPVTVDGHEIPALTVDAVIVRDDAVLLIRRRNPPFEGQWALPGGFVDYGEAVEDACVREAKEETAVAVELTSLLGVYSRPDRDPRHHTVSVAFLAHAPADARAEGRDDATEAAWHPLDALPPLAFDHAEILADARRRLQQGH